MEVAILANRRKVPPYGLDGGEPGACGANWIERADGSVDPMTGTDKRRVSDGDVFVIETPAGGGFGEAE
jgi:5-oxoprolinase (ATP-hydrolysing)